ncbi:MAG: hypothetical protein HC855_09600 [Rhizobiales bacterium]|nr:hypothetical protein [Hyphomicrobiales bacterium]
MIDDLAIAAPDYKYSVQPFKWSGANSERDRRAAGQALAAELRQLEKAGQPYHLMGHSHGGSVIWHALKVLDRSGSSFGQLGSWITIGTPFLDFRVRSAIHSWLLFAVALLLLVFFLVAVPTILALTPEAMSIVRGAPLPALVAVGLGVLGLATLTIYVLSQLVGQVSLRLRQGRTVQHVDKLAERWLCLTHRFDEPVNGLAASLNDPIRAAPRMRRDDNGFSSVISRPFAILYDGAVAPLIDAFVWDTGISKLQGRDIGGLVMISCAVAPPELRDRFRALPETIQIEISESANQASSQTVERLRSELLRFADGSAGPDEITTAISWSEVIHTSYFDNTMIAKTCAAFVRKNADNSTAEPLLGWWLAKAGAASHKQRKPFEPKRLYWAGAGLMTAAVAVLSFGTFASYQAWISPYTNAQQIAVIAENMRKPQFTMLWEDKAPGETLMRLAALGRSDDTLAALTEIRNPNTSIMAAEMIAYAFGFRGDNDAISRLNKDYGKTEIGTTNSNVAIILEIYALVGATHGKRPIASDLAAAVSDRVTKQGMALLEPSGLVALHAAEALTENGKPDAADILLDGVASLSCDDVRSWLTVITNYRRQPGVAAPDLDKCLGGDYRTSTAAPVEPPPVVGGGDPFREPLEALYVSGKFNELATSIVSWDAAAKTQSEQSLYQDDLLNYWRAFADNGLAEGQARVAELYEARLRGNLDGMSLRSSTNVRQVSEFADGMIAIGKTAELAKDAQTFDTKSLEPGPVSIVEAEAAASAGIAWLKLGDRTRAERASGGPLAALAGWANKGSRWPC